MHLLHLEVESFRGAPDGRYTFQRDGIPMKVAAILGGAASGKTSLLEAIVAIKEAAGAYRLPLASAAQLLRSGASTGRIEASWRLTPEEADASGRAEPIVTTRLDLHAAPSAPPRPQDVFVGANVEVAEKLSTVFGRYSSVPNVWKLEYFSANRSLSPPASAPGTDAQELRVRPTSAASKYGTLLPWVRQQALADGANALREASQRGAVFAGDVADALKRMRSDIARALPDLRLVGLSTSPADLVFEHRDGRVLRPDQLSEFERQVVLFAGAFQRFGLDRALVLVDAPELHVATADHVRMVTLLAHLAQAGQLVVATGSDSIAAAVPANQRIRLGG